VPTPTAYLLRQRPDLADRLTRGSDYRFGEWFALKPAEVFPHVWASEVRGVVRRTWATRSGGVRSKRRSPPLPSGWPVSQNASALIWEPAATTPEVDRDRDRSH
jgi:hypothetical protein